MSGRVVDDLDVASHELCRGIRPPRISADELASAACRRTDRPLVAAAGFADSTEPAAAVRSCSPQGESYQLVPVAWWQHRRVS